MDAAGVQNQDRKIIADTHLNLDNLLSNSIISLTNLDLDQHKEIDMTRPTLVDFNEPLWHFGHQVGIIKGQFKMWHLPFLSQMRIGVFDNHGIHFSAVVFNQNLKVKGKRKQLQEFSDLKMKIINHDRRVKHLDYEVISSIIGSTMDILKKTDHTTRISFTFESEDQMIDFQNELIELGSHCLEFCEWVQAALRQYYYEILILILQRDCLHLGQLSLKHPSDQKPLSKKLFARKAQTAANYQLFIYKVLRFSIKHLNLRSVADEKAKQ